MGMFLKGILVVLGICLAGVVVAGPVSIKTEKYLRQYLFRDYDKLVRPVKDANRAVPVFVQLTPLGIESVDTDSNKMKLDTWLHVHWHDEYLQWDPNDFGGLEHLNLPVSEVWRPDIAIYTGTPGSAIMPQVETKAVINSNGDVLWVPPFTIENRCQKPQTERMLCDISMLSWTYDITQLQLGIRNGTDMDHFDDTNKDWHLESITPEKENKLFKCCKEAYDTVHFKVALTRDV